MSTATIPGTTTIVELRDDERDAIISALKGEAIDQASRDDKDEARRLSNLATRLELGDEYVNESDEFVRKTLHKRRLEAEIRKLNNRLNDLEQIIVEELAERGEAGVKHAATGKQIVRTQKIWAQFAKAGDKATDEERAAAGQALIDSGLGDYVIPTFNANSVSAHFREQVNAWLAEQADLPEHQRQPLTAERLQTFLPDSARAVWKLDNTPTLSVR